MPCITLAIAPFLILAVSQLQCSESTAPPCLLEVLGYSVVATLLDSPHSHIPLLLSESARAQSNKRLQCSYIWTGQLVREWRDEGPQTIHCSGERASPRTCTTLRGISRFRTAYRRRSGRYTFYHHPILIKTRFSLPHLCKSSPCGLSSVPFCEATYPKILTRTSYLSSVQSMSCGPRPRSAPPTR